MESSDQCTVNGTADPDESSSGTERMVVDNYVDENLALNQVMESQVTEQVVGYLDEETATLVLQSQGIEINGKSVMLAQGTGGNEILLFVGTEQDGTLEHSLVQSGTDADGNPTLAIECESNNLEAVGAEGIPRLQLIGANDLQNLDKNGTLFIQQPHGIAYVDADNNHFSSEALENAVYQVEEKDETTEMVFIPTTSQVISTGSNTRLLHLADVAHSEWATSELHDKDELVKKLSDGSVIVRGLHAHVDPSFSTQEGELSINAVNEQANDNSVQDEHMVPEVETSPPGEGESLILSLPPRDIENAVSVIHISSSALIRNSGWRTVSIQESEELTKETCQSDVTLPAVSTDIINLNCANLKETSDLSSQNTCIEESSNNSNLKDDTDSSNKDVNANLKVHAVEEPMDEDTEESITFQLTSSKNIGDDDSNQNDSISCNENVSLLKDSISCPEDVSQLNDSIGCSEDVSQVKDNNSCNTIDSKQNESINFIDNNSKQENNINFSEDNSKQKDGIPNEDDLKQKDDIPNEDDSKQKNDILNENDSKQKDIPNEDDSKQNDDIIPNENDSKQKDINSNENNPKQKDSVSSTEDVSQLNDSIGLSEDDLKQRKSIICKTNDLKLKESIISNENDLKENDSISNEDDFIKQKDNIISNKGDLKQKDSIKCNKEDSKQKDCNNSDSDASVDVNQIQNLGSKVSELPLKNFENAMEQNHSINCNNHDSDITMDVDEVQNFNNKIPDSSSKNFENKVKQNESITCNINDLDISMDVDQIHNLDSKICDSHSKNYEAEIKQKDSINSCNDNDSDNSVYFDQSQNAHNTISDSSSKNYEVETKQNGSISCHDNDSDTSVDNDQIQNSVDKSSDLSSKNYEIKQKDSIDNCSDNDSDTSVEMDQCRNLDNEISDSSSKNYEVEIKQNGSISCSDNDSNISVNIDQLQNSDNKTSDPSSRNCEVEMKQNGSISCIDNDSDTSVDIDQAQNLNNKISDPSLKSCEIETKQKDNIDCNDNDSDTLIAIDQTQILDSKISVPSSNNCEKEIESTNSEEACSDIQTCPESLLSSGDNSKSVSSSVSINSQSKDHHINKSKQLQSVSSSKLKKAIDEYEFENSSSNLDAKLNLNSSVDAQASDKGNVDDIHTENDATEVSQVVNSVVEGMNGNQTLIPDSHSIKLNGNLSCDENNETCYDNSQDLFDQDSQSDEKNNSRKMLKNGDGELLKNKQNSAFVKNNRTNQNGKAEEVLTAKNGVNNDSKKDRSNNMDLNLTSSDETTVKPPQRTYVRKRRTSGSGKNIELFSLDEFSDPKDEIPSYRTPKIFCPDKQKEQIMIDENNLVDEDGYVNLIPSDMTNRIKAKGTSPPTDDRRIRSLRPRSSDHVEKSPELVKDTEDSVSTCWGAYLMETSFKPRKAEKMEVDAPKSSSLDDLKDESPKHIIKRRIRLPSFNKLNVKNDSYKSGQQWDKLIKSSPLKIRDASSDKRKIREKVKKQVEKTLRNSENFNSSPVSKFKKGRLSKLSKTCKTVLHSAFPSPPEKIKTCGIRFLNDNSTEKNNSSAIDDLSIPSTSTQNLNDFQYSCSNCSFVSNKVNNLITHMKFCTLKSSTNMIDYRVNDMERRQRIRGDFNESISPAKKKSLSGMIDYRFSDAGRRQQRHDFSENDSSVGKPSSEMMDYRFSDMERRQRIRGDSSEMDSSVPKSSRGIDYRFSDLDRRQRIHGDSTEGGSPEDKHSTDMIDYQVNDMERRQRIRGDIFENDIPVECSSTPQNFSSASVNDYYDNASAASSPSQDGISQENDDEGEMDVVEEDEEQESELKPKDANKKKYGYKENEIVWAVVDGRNWPALVHKIDEQKVVLFCIDRPNKQGTSVTHVHMNVPIDELSGKVHSFNDAKWNKRLLTEAGKLPDNDLFVKAVQKADSYIRKRFLYDADIDGFAFFGIRRNVEYADGVDMDDTNILEENVYVDKDTVIDMKEVVDTIIAGSCDQHVIDIYHEIIKSERHILHCTKDGKNLKQLSWFGPFKKNSLMIKLHDYFLNLFKSKFGPKKDVSSYIYEVWIPEAIIKAISLMKHVSLLEAQIVFFGQDMQCLGEEDFAAEIDDS